MFLVCVFSLRYPASNAHAHHLRPVLYIIFTLYLLNGMIFEKKEKVIEHRGRFYFFYKFFTKYLLLGIIKLYTGLFKMIVGVLTTCHTQYT